MAFCFLHYFFFISSLFSLLCLSAFCFSAFLRSAFLPTFYLSLVANSFSFCCLSAFCQLHFCLVILGILPVVPFFLSFRFSVGELQKKQQMVERLLNKKCGTSVRQINFSLFIFSPLIFPILTLPFHLSFVMSHCHMIKKTVFLPVPHSAFLPSVFVLSCLQVFFSVKLIFFLNSAELRDFLHFIGELFSAFLNF